MFKFILALVLGFVAWEISANLRGHLVANFDLAFGRHLMMSYGHKLYWTDDWNKMLKQKYGIEVVDCSSTAYADGYNEVSLDEAIAKFGMEEINQCSRELRNRWKQTER